MFTFRSLACPNSWKTSSVIGHAYWSLQSQVVSCDIPFRVVQMRNVNVKASVLCTTRSFSQYHVKDADLGWILIRLHIFGLGMNFYQAVHLWIWDGFYQDAYFSIWDGFSQGCIFVDLRWIFSGCLCVDLRWILSGCLFVGLRWMLSGCLFVNLR